MKFLVFQHLPVEHPGSFRPLWRRDGITWDTIELDAGDAIPALSGYDALVVMGGPMDVWQEDAHPWLAPEKAAIREWVVRRKMPYLGICLGHQLLAEAVGGAVAPGRVSEVGFGTVDLTDAGRADPAFDGFAARLDVFQWHSAEVTDLPDQAVKLAGNEACAVQAFRYGDAAYGLQFHVELTADTVPEWQGIPEYAASLAEILGPDGASRLAADVGPRLPAFETTAARLHDNFVSIINHRRVAA